MAFLSSLLSFSPYSQCKSPFFILSNTRHDINYVSCKASNEENHQNPQAQGDSLIKFDRRDVLFELGGLYDVTTLGGNNSVLANDDKSLSPDVENCGPAHTPTGNMECCPPKINKIINFTKPIIPKLHVRPALQFATPKQLADFERGIKILKNLKPDDPRNFYQQAKIHCAYCNHAYKQVGSQETGFLIHSNALFFPFHRAYLHFFERILRHFIGDPNFALPFWNWDAPIGMQMPIYYSHNPNSTLYDAIRDPRHKAPKVLDLNYDGSTEDPPYDVVECNLRWMNKQMSVKTNRQFLGKVIKLGETPMVYDDAGTIEKSPHNSIHDWVGDPNNPNREDMGAFYYAGRDPIFYAHHANVDRMWNIWQKMNCDRRHFNDQDWLNSTFVFYDEHRNVVRIKVSDCLESENLGYVYEDVEIPWKDTKQVPRNKRSRGEPEPPIINFPQSLSSTITTMVERPSGVEQQGKEEEVLVIEGVEYDPTMGLHFNVLVNVVDEGEDVCPGNVEFVGSFKNIPRGLKHEATTSLRFVLTDIIEALGLENARKLVVRLDPKVGGDQIKVGGIKIQIQPVEQTNLGLI